MGLGFFWRWRSGFEAPEFAKVEFLDGVGLSDDLGRAYATKEGRVT